MGEKVMSNREQQKKYDRESNVDSSIYSRVNIGQGANNKFDSPNLTHSGGSMSNPDEKRKATYSPLSKTINYYLLCVWSDFYRDNSSARFTIIP